MAASRRRLALQSDMRSIHTIFQVLLSSTLYAVRLRYGVQMKNLNYYCQAHSLNAPQTSPVALSPATNAIVPPRETTKRICSPLISRHTTLDTGKPPRYSPLPGNNPPRPPCPPPSTASTSHKSPPSKHLQMTVLRQELEPTVPGKQIPLVMPRAGDECGKP